MYMLSK